MLVHTVYNTQIQEKKTLGFFLGPDLRQLPSSLLWTQPLWECEKEDIKHCGFQNVLLSLEDLHSAFLAKCPLIPLWLRHFEVRWTWGLWGLQKGTGCRVHAKATCFWNLGWSQAPSEGFRKGVSSRKIFPNKRILKLILLFFFF